MMRWHHVSGYPFFPFFVNSNVYEVAGETVMNLSNTRRRLVALTCIGLTAMLTACSSYYQQNFGASPVGQEIHAMMDACMQMQQAGRLPGIRPGKSADMEFRSEQVAYASRNQLDFPLRFDCTVVQDDKRHTFTMSKQSAGASWQLL